jgi:predicted AlkP superfamily pyrophosphatase or phosphodiesterase
VAVLLFDGMGRALIRKHLPEGAFLRRNVVHTMTSTFPPTTVAATNGLLSARHPIETGWLGWAQYLKEYDTNVDLFSGKHNLTKDPLADHEEIRRRLDYEDILTLIGKQNPTLKVGSIWPSFKPEGAERIEDFFHQVDRTLSEVGPKFVYGYWVQPDLDTHDHGVDSPHIKKIIRDINARLEGGDRHRTTLFLIIADHV